ncbi:hypothetical protein GCM10027418_24860 [Mariniluteicoccus endophyticus]
MDPPASVMRRAPVVGSTKTKPRDSSRNQERGPPRGFDDCDDDCDDDRGPSCASRDYRRSSLFGMPVLLPYGSVGLGLTGGCWVLVVR